MARFKFIKYRTSGVEIPRVIKDITMKNGVSIDEGEMVEIESGEADYGASGSTAIIGVAAESKDNAADGEVIDVIDGMDAIFEVDDANARVVGAALDINSTYNGVTTNSNSDVVVTDCSTATEPTKVMLLAKACILSVAT